MDSPSVDSAPLEGPATEAPPAAPTGGVAGLLLSASFVAGSLALLAGMATDFVAVVLRHLNIPFIGAIEIVQACVVLTISSAVVAATLTRSHAAVHLVTERLPGLWRAVLARISSALGFACFAAFAVGEVWLIHDTRDWNERSDLLGLPIWPLRLVWAASLSLVALLFLLRALRPAREPRG